MKIQKGKTRLILSEYDVAALEHVQRIMILAHGCAEENEDIVRIYTAIDKMLCDGFAEFDVDKEVRRSDITKP